MSLSYAIIGVGGVGGYLGAKLAQAGFDVHFLANSDFDHIKKHGLKVDSYRGNMHLPDVHVYNDPSAMPKCDILLLCMKTTLNKVVPGILKKAAGPSSTLLILQNGIGMEEDIAEALPDLNIAGGPIYIGSHKAGPGYIQHLDIGTMTIAPYTPGIMHILQQAAEELTKADVKTNIADNLDMLRWKKLVWNVPFNGLSVVLNTTCDKIVGNSDTCDLSKAIMLEIIAAAGANGCTIDATFADKMIELTKNMVPYAPSMKVDFDNNRELEVEFIYSRPVRYGTAKGIKMPKTSELEAKLKAISSRR